MLRCVQTLLAAAILAVSAPLMAIAAEGEGPAVPLPAFGDLFAVPDVRIDASAEAALLARDNAMAQGRRDAWARLFRRLTATAQWGKQPQLDDNQLLRLVRNFEVSGERRSTTRYLADVTYRFNPVAVRAVLRQANIPYTETRSKPALVIPIIDGKRYDPASPWAAVWKDPSYRQGLVPMVPVRGEGEDLAVVSRADLTQVDWAGFDALASRYDVGEIVLAIASDDANTVQAIEISPAGRVPASFGFADSNFMADADAIADKVAETWKTRNAVDFGSRARLVADVQFDSLAQWAKIRTQLRASRSVAAVDIVGVASNEAEISVSYFGKIDQLCEALAQQSLQLSGAGSNFTLQLGRPPAANTP
jgi:hypothetical protein